ncbi:hypothetical protein CJU90_4387 [Yarrowia sp. C11]|nr:hypothetical protein CKK34_6669 [Yarrowia sp. E02]KAG5365318.1 hypothetical protein CJU90_4387 [Yarrowia sp. C11]
MTDKKGKQMDAGILPMDNSDTDYDVLSISSRCVSSDDNDNDLRGGWYGVGQLDDDTDDPECVTFSQYDDNEDVPTGSSPPLSPQSLKMPTLAFSIDSLSESTPTPSKYFFKDDLKLEWDVVSHKPARNPPRYRDGHNLPPLGAPVDRVCLLNLCGTPSPLVQKFFVHYYGFKTEVEILNLADIDNIKFHPSTSYVGLITFTSEESISSALLKVDAALNARARGIYVTCWAPSQLSATSLINTSVFAALKPLQDSSVLSFPLALDSFDPLDIQLIEWEEHSVRRKRSSTLMFQFDQKKVWKAIVAFLVLAITAQISQYFLLYSIGDVNIVAPEIAPAASTTGFDHCVLNQQHAGQQRLMPPPDKPTIEEDKPKKKAHMDFRPMKDAVWRTIKRAQRHKLVRFTRSRGLDFRQRVVEAHVPERVQKAMSQCVSAQASFQTSMSSLVHKRLDGQGRTNLITAYGK